jgi:hypothetical protein
MGNLDRHRHKSSLPAKGGNTLWAPRYNSQTQNTNKIS